MQTFSFPTQNFWFAQNNLMKLYTYILTIQRVHNILSPLLQGQSHKSRSNIMQWLYFILVQAIAIDSVLMYAVLLFLITGSLIFF